MFLNRRLLLSPESSPGTPPNPPSKPPESAAGATEAPVALPTGEAPVAPPPAAKIVLEGTKTEREVALERQVKERETRLSELEDENRRLKTPPTPTKAQEKGSWLTGATFFE